MAKKKKKYEDILKEIKEARNLDVDKELSAFQEYVENNRPVEAPIRSDLTSEKKERTWFDKGAFDDGYDFGDVTRTILGSGADLLESASTGILGMGEKAVDALAYLAPAFNASQTVQNGGSFDIKTYRQQQEWSKEFIEKDLYDEDKLSKKLITENAKKIGIDAENNSVFGEKSDALIQSAGQLGGTVALQAMGVPWWLTTGATSFGSEAENALEQGASYDAAGGSALISAAAETLTEKLSGGIKFGGKTLDDVYIKPLTEKITNKTVKALANVGIDAVGEGGEEVLSNVISNLGTKLYKEESIGELIASEEALDGYIESFIGGAVLGGGVSGVRALRESNAEKKAESLLTDNEQSVVNAEVSNRTAEVQKQKTVADRIKSVIEEQERTFGSLTETEKKNIEQRVRGQLDAGELDYTKTELSKKELSTIEKEVREDLERGYIGIDTIESTFASEKTAQIKELEQSLINVTDDAKKAEIEAKIGQLKVDRATELTGKFTNDNYLQESYRQEALKKQEFEYEISESDSDITKELVESAKNSKMNNTRKMHELFEYTNKIANDTGTKYGFVNNKQLKQLGHDVEGKTVNGLVRVNKDGSSKILINIDSDKALNTIIGHETTHLLEGTSEYKALQELVKEYATTKGEYDSRLKQIKGLYEGVDANVENEVTADLVGDYLFTDEQFINNLSAKQPNVFQKIYDFIKHAYKMVTAGSKEARQLEQVKRKFDKAYKEMSKTTTGKADSNLTTEADSNKESRIKYDMSEDKSLYQYIKDALSGKLSKKSFYKLSANISDRLANDIEKIVGFSVEGYSNEISPGNIEHIDKRHGVNGIQDRSMSDLHELAKIGYVIENYDKIREGKLSTQYRNSDKSKAKTVELQKKIDDEYYYVVEAVPDATLKTLHVVSAYKNKKDTFSEEAVPKGPSRYVLDEAQSNVSSKESIHENNGKSNTKYSLSDSKGRELTKEQQTYFKDSKVRDDNGSLKVMYHGTGSDFTIFDTTIQGGKNGTAEGYGIYFTDSEEVAKPYSNNGKLMQGYLNITKPATSFEKTIKKSDLINLIKATAEAEAKASVDDGEYDSIEEALKDTWVSNYVYTYDAPMSKSYKEVAAQIIDSETHDMGIVQEVMAGLGIRDYDSANQFYNVLKDTLGIDGFVTEWETPELESGKTQVVLAFNSNQFKNVDNANPTENPDINLSLSSPGDIAPVNRRDIYGRDVKLQVEEAIAPLKEEIADLKEAIAPAEEDLQLSRPLTEEDLPLVEQERDEAFNNLPEYVPEDIEYYNEADKAPLDDSYLRLVAKNMRSELGLKGNQLAGLRKIIQNFSTSDEQNIATLYDAIESEFGTIQEPKKLAEVAEIKDALRTMRIKVSDVIKGDIPDYAKWKQKQFGKIRFANDGLDVDDVYEGLKDIYPGFFPDDIINPTDQLLKIAEVAGMDSKYMEEYLLPEEKLQEVTEYIYDSVTEYKQQKRLDAAREAAKAPIDESMIPFEEPVKKKTLRDIAPINSSFDRNDFTVSRGVQQKYDLPSGEITENERDVEIERLEKKKRQALEDLGDLTTFTKNMAEELYDEVRSMTAGRRVSSDLGYILDRMFKGVSKSDPEYQTIKDETYKRITDALIDIGRKPVKPEGTVRPTEELIRRAIENRYNWKVDDINSWELDPIAKTRRELRKKLINPDFLEKALDEAKNIPMALMNNTDTIRNTELVFGRENGKVINDLIFQRAIDNEAKSIAWQNKERKEIAALGIKAKDKYGRVTKESEAIQKYGEGKYLDDNGDYIIYDDDALMKDFPDPEERAKIKKAAKAIRDKYDTYIDTANEVLTSLGFEAIPKRDDYMRHFQALNDVFTNFGIPFNPQAMQEHSLPTDINGLTEFWTPQKNYFANIQPRKGMRTTLDAITGIDGYISGIANLIYHTEDIQRGRALEDLIRENFGQEKGFDNLQNLSEEEQAVRMEKIEANHLSNYAAWVHEWTNNIAGKKNRIDRSIESMFGRKAFSFLDETRKQVGANMIGFNVSSSLTNLISSVQAMAKTNKLAVAKGTADTIRNIFVKDNFAEKNSFLTARMGTEMLSKTAWEKMRDAGYVFMKGMDWFTSNQITRSKYYELKSKGMSEEEAHAEAGKFAARVMGDRTKGANAQLYNSKMVGLLTQFQLEVNNQLYSMFYDTYHESKEKAQNDARKTAAGMTFTLGQLFAFTHLYGKTFEAIAGYNPTFDVIGILATALGVGGDDEEDKPVIERLQDAGDQLVGSLPYINIFKDGGRIPIASGIPNLLGLATGGKDKYGNDLKWEDEAKKLLFLIPPTGGNQIKKTTQGLGMFDSDLPVSGSYTDSGNLRFPVEDTPLNRLQAGLFGQWANENARNYFDNERQPLKEKQIQEYKDLDLPISDYWKYREGLKKQKTTEDKFNYIAGLDLPVDKKNIMINNAVDRKETVDLINYDDFGSYEEFDFATRYPEKYEFFESNGISYRDYKESEESKEAYNWAYNNPEKYSVAKAAAPDVVTYRSYVADLNNIKADQDGNGKTITGSRKIKVANYINSLDAEYGSKLILFKSEYPSDDRYNYEIIEYLNNRQDISYDEEVTILTELGFVVDADGNVRW